MNAKNPSIDTTPNAKSQRQETLHLTKAIFLIYLNIGTFYGVYLLIASASLANYLYIYALGFISTNGIAVGAHRLWAHRTYKAKLPLRLLLAFEQTMSFQLAIYDWVRDHRLHHKYSDTEFDPHNSTRGFFWCHMGWIFYKKSPDVIRKGKELDLSDLLADPVVVYQKKYYWYFAPFVAFVIPTVIPWYFWDVPFWDSFYMFSILRVGMSLHGTGLVNSVAHMWGSRPYDKNICPVETMFVSIASNGEGFHNYHHVYPWDYKAAELGNYYGNWNTAFIDLMAKLGLAYDLKYASKELVARRAKRTGDGSWKEINVWGWGDKDMDKEDIRLAESG